eukprot:g5076.t1
MHEIWPQFDDENVGYLVPSQLQRLIERFTKAKITEEHCQYFINSIDQNRNSRIEKDELSDFIGKGITMDETQRATYKARGGAQATILSFFDAVKQQMSRSFNASVFVSGHFSSSKVSKPRLPFHDASHFPIAEEENPHRYAARFFSDLHYHNYITATLNLPSDIDEPNLAKIYLVDGTYLKIRFNKVMTFKHLCVTIKSILKLENDEDFSCYLCSSSADEQSDNVGRLLNENDNVDIAIKNISAGPFKSGELVLVSPIDINKDKSTVVDMFLKKEWYKFNHDLKPLGEAHLKAFFDYYTQQATPEKMCKAFVKFIDTDNNSEITLQELGRYISMGIGMSSLERKDFGSRNDANKILVSLFDEIERRIYDEKVNAVVIKCTKKGNPYLENGHYEVEYFDYSTQKKVTIVAYEKYMERLGKIVYRRNAIYKSVSFETEAKNKNRDYSYAHRLLFAEFYGRYIHDYFKPSIGCSIEFAAILLLMDLIGYPHANVGSDNLLPYGHALGPYVPRRILNQFCGVKKIDLLAQRIKDEARILFATLGEQFTIADLQYDSDMVLSKLGEVKTPEDQMILPYHRPKFLKFRQKLERSFIHKCKENFPRIYNDSFFHVAIAETSLLQTCRGKLDILTSTDLIWQNVSIGFGKDCLNVIKYEAGRLSILHSFPYKILHEWECSANSCLLRLWYADDQAIIIKSFSVVDISDGLSEHVQDANDVKANGRQRRQSRRYGKKDLENLFGKFDVDGSGFLDTNEIQEMMVTLGRPLSTQQTLSETLGNLDKDENGKISFNNFCQWWNRDYDNNHSITIPFHFSNEKAKPEDLGITMATKSNLKSSSSPPICNLTASGKASAKQPSRPSCPPPKPPLEETIKQYPTQPKHQQTSAASLPKRSDILSICDTIINRYDTDGSGQLDPKQIKTMLETSLHKDVSKDDCVFFIVYLDADGDGCVQKTELINFCHDGLGMSEKQKEVFRSRGDFHRGHVSGSVTQSSSEIIVDDYEAANKQDKGEDDNSIQSRNISQSEESNIIGSEYGLKSNTYDRIHKSKNSTPKRIFVRESLSQKKGFQEDIHYVTGNKTAAQGQNMLERGAIARNRSENEESNAVDDNHSNMTKRNENEKLNSGDKPTDNFSFFDQLGFFGMKNF